MTATATSPTPRLTRLLAPRPLAGTWRNAARLGFGGFFLATATFNATVTLPDAAAFYTSVADELAWAGFDWLLRQLVVPAAVPLTVLLVAFQVGVAMLVLSKGRQVRLGLLAAIAFMIGLVPLMSWYELGNVPLVALALLLLGRDYDRSLIGMVHRQQSGRHLTGHGPAPAGDRAGRQPPHQGADGAANEGGQDDSTDDSQTPPHAHRTTT